MPAPRKKLHELASIVAEKTVITDTRKQRFIIEKEFARGGFGRIYSGKQEGSSEYGKTGSVAIKIEPQANGPLFTEITVFQRILSPDKLKAWMDRNKANHIGLPPYVSSGLFTYNGEKLRFLIMPRYEKSLETYRTASGGILDISIVLVVAKQCADCLSYMQEHDYVHGDLKADNILLASANAFYRCFLIDFGLAKMAKKNVAKADKKRAHNGTLLFTSLDAHHGFAPSFRGDLEILAYNMIYWLCGTLPWQKCTEKAEAVMAEKQKFTKELDKSIGKLVSSECAALLSKLFSLAYETPYLQKVDYEAVHSILDQMKATVSLKKSRSKSTGEKEFVKTMWSRRKVNTSDSSCCISRKRKMKTGDIVPLISKELVQKDIVNNTTTGHSAQASICEHKTISKQNSSPSPIDSGSGSAEKPPELKRHKSDRNAVQLSVENDKSMKIGGKNSSKAIGSNKALKKGAKKLYRKSRKGLQSSAKQSSFLSTSPPSNENKQPIDSPSKKLGSIIPGVRNMKNIRRSLKETLVKKYISVPN